MHAAVIPTHLTTAQNRAFVVTIGGRDLTSLVKWETLTSQDAGGNARGVTSLRLEARLSDLPEVTDQAALRVYNHAQDFNMARAYVRSRRPVRVPRHTHLDVRADSNAALLDDSFVAVAARPAESLRARIGFLMAYYGGSHLSGDLSQVQDFGGTLPEQRLDMLTLRQALEQSLAQADPDADYYVSAQAQGRLHVYVTEDNDAPFFIGPQ